MSIRSELKRIDENIKANREAIQKSEERIKNLTKLRETFYCDGGILPPGIISDGDAAKFRKMPRGEFPCEYCEADEVRKGKVLICLNCGHKQGGGE